MTVTLLSPDLRRVLDGLAHRLGILERRLSVTGAAGSVPNDDIIFSYAGALTAIESPPVKLRHDSILSVLAVGLGTAGSTSTTLEIKRNGTVVATVVVPTSAADYGANVGVRFAGEDRLSINISAVGTGAANMTATARFT